MLSLLALRELADKYPAPPILEEDTENKVFSHKSLFSLPAHVQVRQDEPKDWERLAFLGDQVLSMCTTEVIFERYPHARSSFLTNKRSLIVSNDQVAKWSQAYGFPARIQAQSSQIQLLQSNVTAQASVFEAYVGAVYSLEGHQTAARWLTPIICRVLDAADNKAREEPAEEEEEEEGAVGGDIWHQEAPPLEFFTAQRLGGMTLLEEDNDESVDFSRFGSIGSTPLSQQSLLRPGSSTPKARTRGWGSPSSTQGIPAQQDQPFHYAGEPARKASSVSNPSALKFRAQGGPSTIGPTGLGSSSPSSPPYSPSPKPPTPSSSTISTSSHTTGNGFLALFNQLADQKHVETGWTTGMSGPAHKPTFDAKVTVGTQTWSGTAHNKQAAKQIAARNALRGLKWLEPRKAIAAPLFVKRDTHRLWRSAFKARTSTLPRIASLFRASFRRLPA